MGLSGVRREIGRGGFILVRRDVGQTVRQRLVDDPEGIAAQYDPLRRELLIGPGDDFRRHLRVARSRRGVSLIITWTNDASVPL